MPDSGARENTVLPKVVRIKDAARAVLNRLDSGDTLSSVLPQAKAVVDDYGSRIHSFWLEFEIHGLDAVPLAEMPPTDRDRKTGAYLVAKLHSASDPTDVTVDSVIQQWNGGEESIPDRKKVITSSISQIERYLESWEQAEEESAQLSHVGRAHANRHLQLIVLNDERARILNSVRAYLYDYIAKIEKWALAECENQALLGPDYRIVVDSLEALQSGVGQELVGALEILRNPNPALWSATALVCRNVVLILGDAVWKVPGDTYESQLAAKPLVVKGEKEVNRLLAFIDYHHRVSDDAAKPELEEMHELAITIYERGCKGKKSKVSRYAEAQGLVVDTFRLVSGLQQLTGLEPVTHIS